MPLTPARRALVLSILLVATACDASPMRTDGGGSGGDAGTGSGECLAPREVCGSQCVDTTSDPRHCGMCNNRCPAGGFCSDGMCSASCASPLTACGESCVDLSSSADHCGDCDTACASDRECVSGGCACAGGLQECGTACVDRMSSSLHCGRCDNPCPNDQACVMGECTMLAETDCNDMVDNDMDGMTDCADSDCEGTERACTCPTGMSGMNPAELCMGGTWATCGPCGPTPDCSATSPCAYGYSCQAGSCVFNPGALYDVILVDAPYIPATNYGGGSWDAFGGAPDVYAEVRLSAGVTGPTSMVQDDTYTPMWNERVYAGVHASELMSYFEIQLWDYDALDPDDLIGACSLTLRERDFDGHLRTSTCGRNDGAMTPGWRVNIMIVPSP
ncbi:MAG: hypothetical protein AB7S26_16935 [Sandaracinaceae bacterium]